MSGFSSRALGHCLASTRGHGWALVGTGWHRRAQINTDGLWSAQVWRRRSGYVQGIGGRMGDGAVMGFDGLSVRLTVDHVLEPILAWFARLNSSDTAHLSDCMPSYCAHPVSRQIRALLLGTSFAIMGNWNEMRGRA
jgi:hypothetical protein